MTIDVHKRWSLMSRNDQRCPEMVWNEQKITLDVKVKEDEEPRSRKACLQDLARWCRKMVDKNGGYSPLCLYVLIVRR